MKSRNYLCQVITVFATLSVLVVVPPFWTEQVFAKPVPSSLLTETAEVRESSIVPVSSSQASVESLEIPEAIANVAIFQDSSPWGTTRNEDVLAANGISFTIFNSGQMGVVDLSPYDKVIISSVQGSSFYSKLEANRAWFESYVAAGGILDLHVATQGPEPVLPGGFVCENQGFDDVTIVDPAHLILMTPHLITDADLDGWNYSTHGYFSVVPAGAHEIIEIAGSGQPCAMELIFGAGRIFATVQTVEWRGASYNYLENTILYEVLDDLHITPSEDFISSGGEGGPFTPECKTYTLTNNGAGSLDWSATATQTWLDVTPDSGALVGGASTTVDVCINANANILPLGVYTDNVTFSNLTSGVSQTRSVLLEVIVVPGEIEVTDTIPPVDDLNMPFSGVIVGLSRIEQVTITNTDPDHELIVDMFRFEGFFDDFPETTINPENWTDIVSFPVIDDVGIAEPSPPYSLRLNGYPDGGEAVMSRVIDLSGLSGLNLIYWYQRTGGGEDPDPGEDLVFRYWNGSYWEELSRQLGSGPDMVWYEEVVVPLPIDAYHDGFRLKISNTGSSCNCDDWFVDDVSITMENGAAVFLFEDNHTFDQNDIVIGEVFYLENLPNFPAAIPPLGSITFDVNFTPAELTDYNSTLVITSDDRDEPEVAVQLSGSGIPDYLEIVPDVNFEFSGHPGGPFVPTYQHYEVNNIGPISVDWAVAPDVSWLYISPSGGVLSAGESVAVSVTCNSQADALPEGYYDANVVFSDLTTGFDQVRQVNLSVYTEPKIWASPLSFEVTIPQGCNDIQILTIGNTGGSALDFSLSSYQTDFTPLLDRGPVSAVAQVETIGDKIVLEYEFSEPVVVIGAEGEYDSVQIEGLPAYGRTGAPIIPVRPVTVLIPYGKEVVTTRVMSSFDARQLEGTYELPPAQEPYPLSYHGTVEPTEPDPAIYGQATPWPGVDHEEVAAQSKRGYQLFVVNLFPLQYVPTTGTISYAGKLRLEIDLVDAPTLGILRPSDTVKAELSAAVDNLTVLETYPKSVTSLETLGQPKALPPGGPYQYVIVTNETLEAAPGSWNFQSLRDAKIARGMTATIVTTQWIYANYDGTKPSGGSDNQTRIRNFLIDAYQTWGTEYVLLGGTNGIVPARMFRVDGENMPVDMYYGCVEPAACTFDYDADGYYGEPTDGVGGGDVDLYAEIYVGRATVENATELENFIKKTLTYDLTENDEYLPRIAMLGEYIGFGGVAEYAKDAIEQIRLGGNYDGYFTYGFENHLQSNFIDFNTIDCLPDSPGDCWPLYDKDYDWPKSDLIDLMNGGVHVLNHLGHANYTYGMKLYTSDLASLTNTDYFFAYSQGCDSGGFDIYNCFAEVLTSMEHGAFAAVMNARSGWGKYNSTDGPSQRFDREFWDAVLGEGMLEVGRVNQDSKEDNLWDINGSYIRYCYYGLNLFGDPAQRLQFTKSSVSSDWLDFVPDAGTVAAGEIVDVNVIFDGNQPGGTYCGHITTSSTDPYVPEVNIPVTMTVEPIDYFTELFDPNYLDPSDPNCNDMAYRTLTFRLGGANYYKACINEANDFPVDPNGGTIVSLGDDDYVAVSLNGAHVNFYGTDYDTFYIGSNGYISFISGDIRHFETLADHFDLPRVSALFDDLDPSAGGTISWKQLDDRVVVTFENVPEYSLSNSNSFQIEMRFNGKIRITFLEVAAKDGLVGLSEGYGLPPWFTQSDLSEYSLCNFIGDLNGDLNTDLTDFAIFGACWRNRNEDMETVRDEFNTVSYSGNDGTRNWNNNWQESGESDGPSSGLLQVVPDGSMRLGYKNAKDLPTLSLTREADLGGATEATLTYEYVAENEGNEGYVSIQVSGDGGLNWDTLANYPYDAGSGSASFDITQYISSNTQIRFVIGPQTKIRMYLHVDNIQIEYDDPDRPWYPWCNGSDFSRDFRVNFEDLWIFCEHWLE